MQDALAKARLFTGIADTTRAELEAVERHQTFGPGDVIFRQGDPATAMILVVRGLAKVWRTAENGTPITLTLLGPGEPIGTLHMVRDMPLTSTVSAHIATEAMLWPIGPVRRIMAQDAALFGNIATIVARYAVQMIERLEELATAPVEQRVARALCRASHAVAGRDGVAELPLSRQDVADMSATTLPSVSRIMARWREQGLIGGYRGRILLLDRDGLRDAAQLARQDEALEIPLGAP